MEIGFNMNHLSQNTPPFQFPNKFSHLFELVGGGLVRSVGDWLQVFSLRKKDIRAASDYRILGSSEFDQGLLSEIDEREKETLCVYHQR
jgi:hypothetical protein